MKAKPVRAIITLEVEAESQSLLRAYAKGHQLRGSDVEKLAQLVTFMARYPGFSATILEVKEPSDV